MKSMCPFLACYYITIAVIFCTFDTVCDMDNQFGGYVDYVRIGHAGDALQVIDQILEEGKFDQESVRAVLEALKDAIQRGILQ